MSHSISTINVKSARGSYPVIVGYGVEKQLATSVRKGGVGARVFAVFDANLFALHGASIERAIKQSGRPLLSAIIPSGEQTKSEKTVSQLHDLFLGEGIARHDLILACGGGVTSDVVGYAAATVLRGVRWGICATTLLSVVDASIGGKTAINHSRGKNLIGAFWPPVFVVSDLNWLGTLDQTQLRNGLGEVIKAAGLAGGRLLNDTTQSLAGGRPCAIDNLRKLIGPCIRYKARVVSQDERDQGMRQRLNYGHTFGHAVEQSLGYRRLVHGEAVILGMLGALELGERLGIGEKPSLNQFRHLVLSACAQLPQVRLDPDHILLAMRLDKKRDGKGLQFVLLKRPGHPTVVSGVPVRTIRQAVQTMVDYNRKA
jgi:3-dehydroquinate synthase